MREVKPQGHSPLTPADLRVTWIVFAVKNPLSGDQFLHCFQPKNGIWIRGLRG
jgi:hypothetical protein